MDQNILSEGEKKLSNHVQSVDVAARQEEIYQCNLVIIHNHC